MALEHDRIHFETSSMLIRQLPVDLVEKPVDWKYAPTLGHSPSNEWITMSGRTIKIGKPMDSDIYGWDNEFGSLTIDVQPFKATKNLITNADYLTFVNSGAYNKNEYWSEEGRSWKAKSNVSSPKFWVKSSDGFLSVSYTHLTLPTTPYV